MDDLLFRESRICADKSYPVLLVADTYDLCRDLPVFVDHYIYRKQVLTAAAAFLADAKDLVDVEPFSHVLIVYTGTLFNHGNGLQAKVFGGNELCWAGEPRVKQDVVCMVAGGLNSLQELNHDIRALHLRKFPPPGGERPSITLIDRPDEFPGFRRSQQAAVYRKECIAIRPAECHKSVTFTVLHRYIVEYPGSEFSLFATCALEQAIINNKSVDTIFTCKGFN